MKLFGGAVYTCTLINIKLSFQMGKFSDGQKETHVTEWPENSVGYMRNKTPSSART